MISVSVVMPVYNTPIPILKDAVDSILNQTFQDFEFIIIDDGSEGEIAAYLKTLSDPRIKLLRNDENIGITKSLNMVSEREWDRISPNSLLMYMINQ